MQLFFKKNTISFAHIKKSITFALAIEKQTIAQMAESVDALVSNTSGATHPGSIPGLGTTEKGNFLRFLFYPPVTHWFADILGLTVNFRLIGQNST